MSASVVCHTHETIALLRPKLYPISQLQGNIGQFLAGRGWTLPMIRRLTEKLWFASRKESRIARTIVLKLKTSDFKILTRRV